MGLAGPIRCTGRSGLPAGRVGPPGAGLAEVWAIEWERARAAAPASLAPHLTPELLAEALAAARVLGTQGGPVRWRRPPGPTLTPQLLAEALTAVQAIKWERARALALAALAPHLTLQERDRALTGALAAVRAIKYPEDRSERWPPLAPHLTPQERDQVLTERGAARRSGTSRPGPGPRPGPPPDAGAAGQRAGHGAGDQVRRGPGPTLAALAPHLTPELLAERWPRRGRSGTSGGPEPRRWPPWPPGWQSWAIRLRCWLRRERSGPSGPGPRRWPPWPPT